MSAQIKMKELVSVKNARGNLAGEETARSVYLRITEALEREARVSIDLDGIENLSPSFAYEAFGKLVDRFGPAVNMRISFENDPLFFSKRIIQALERRKKVVEANEGRQ